MSDIVLVSGVCDLWIDQATARKVAEEMKGGTVFITLQGNMIATNTIKGLLKPAVYKTHCVNSRRNWTCSKGSGHTFDQRCDCRDAQAPLDLSQQALNSHNELTVEQTAEAKLKADAQREWINQCKPDWKKAANDIERKKFVDDYIKNYGKTIDSTVA